jgi:DNA-binding NarL/FixJ family response regulator
VSTRRVLIADDHAPIRAGVRATLRDAGFDVCAEAADAQGAVEAAVREQPDLCLLDINMPGSGIRAAAEIRARVPSAAIVMLTVSRDDDDLFSALKAGALGYLLKDIDPERLPSELEAVLSGDVALPRSLVATLVGEFRRRDRRRVVRLRSGQEARLTPREWEVLEELEDGRTTTQIAQRLVVNEVTVRTHVASILKKCEVVDRRELLRLLEAAR